MIDSIFRPFISKGASKDALEIRSLLRKMAPTERALTMFYMCSYRNVFTSKYGSDFVLNPTAVSEAASNEISKTIKTLVSEIEAEEKQAKYASGEANSLLLSQKYSLMFLGLLLKAGNIESAHQSMFEVWRELLLPKSELDAALAWVRDIEERVNRDLLPYPEGGVPMSDLQIYSIAKSVPDWVKAQIRALKQKKSGTA